MLSENRRSTYSRVTTVGYAGYDIRLPSALAKQQQADNSTGDSAIVSSLSEQNRTSKFVWTIRANVVELRRRKVV
ncbi:hypothetical protein KIN20_007735 [Parelaphostrongylus tenuis]|uniref:Uncharacterized protein n=1 Tax=Parelaphostrongylus tenuis TaxID=148309 RepID=A0AAD5M6Y4_PARTN|nr:hypothetical protein KIN20_007735 [Parelaphostrongylus tenuis]